MCLQPHILNVPVELNTLFLNNLTAMEVAAFGSTSSPSRKLAIGELRRRTQFQVARFFDCPIKDHFWDVLRDTEAAIWADSAIEIIHPTYTSLELMIAIPHWGLHTWLNFFEKNAWNFDHIVRPANIDLPDTICKLIRERKAAIADGGAQGNVEEVDITDDLDELFEHATLVFTANGKRIALTISWNASILPVIANATCISDMAFYDIDNLCIFHPEVHARHECIWRRCTLPQIPDDVIDRKRAQGFKMGHDNGDFERECGDLCKCLLHHLTDDTGGCLFWTFPREFDINGTINYRRQGWVWTHGGLCMNEACENCEFSVITDEEDA